MKKSLKKGDYMKKLYTVCGQIESVRIQDTDYNPSIIWGTGFNGMRCPKCRDLDVVKNDLVAGGCIYECLHCNFFQMQRYHE